MTKPQPAPLPTDRPLFEELEPRRLFALNVYGGDVVVANLMNPDGSQKNASAVTVPFNLGLRITDATGIQMRGFLTDPTTGSVRKVVIPVTDVTRDPGNANLLHFNTQGIVPRDAKLVIQPGALRDGRDRPITEQNVRFPKGASPAAFTFSRRALVATDKSLFSGSVFTDPAAAIAEAKTAAAAAAAGATDAAAAFAAADNSAYGVSIATYDAVHFSGSSTSVNAANEVVNRGFDAQQAANNARAAYTAAADAANAFAGDVDNGIYDTTAVNAAFSTAADAAAAYAAAAQNVADAVTTFIDLYAVDPGSDAARAAQVNANASDFAAASSTAASASAAAGVSVSTLGAKAVAIGSTVDTTPPADRVEPNSVIRHDFANFLKAKVSKGTIDQAKADATLARYDDARVNEIIPSPNLRAALLSLVGTIAEPAIATMLDGQNVSGRAFTVIDFTDETSPQAEVAETKANGVGRLRTILKPQFAGEPFQVLGAYLGHEALHQDADDGQQEEIIANTVENFVYAQQALVDGRFVSANTPLVKRENDKLLAMLNSGHAKAGAVGLSAGAAQVAVGVFAGGVVEAGGPIQSFEDLVRREYVARDFGSYSTATNDTLLAYYKNITGTSKTVKFGDALIADLDANQKVITESNMMALAGLLKLTAV